jgi:hypothetical protein
MAQEWAANAATNFGLLLDSDTSKPRDRYRAFASTENADPGLRPFPPHHACSLAPDVTPPIISAVLASTLTTSGATLTGPRTSRATQVDTAPTSGLRQPERRQCKLLSAHRRRSAGWLRARSTTIASDRATAPATVALSGELLDPDPRSDASRRLRHRAGRRGQRPGTVTVPPTPATTWRWRRPVQVGRRQPRGEDTARPIPCHGIRPPPPTAATR